MEIGRKTDNERIGRERQLVCLDRAEHVCIDRVFESRSCSARLEPGGSLSDDPANSIFYFRVLRAAVEEASAAGVRVRAARAALPVRTCGVLAAHARAARVDPPHVPGAAGAPRLRALLARPLRRQPQALLGHTQVREQDLSYSRH